MAYQDDPSADVARVLQEITAEETKAHIESRVVFLERQIERLEGRRDEQDQSMHSALDVMRARIADVLAAVSGSEEQHRAALTEVETRTMEALRTVERKGRESSGSSGSSAGSIAPFVVEGLTRRIDDVSALVASLESRLVHEARVLSESMATFRDEIKALVGPESPEIQRGSAANSHLQIKIDELANRISTTDARWAADRAALSARLEALEAVESPDKKR